MNRRLTYLATPYSHADVMVRIERYSIVTKVAANLMRSGELIYSPISHTHHMAVWHGLPTDFGYWEEHCKAFLSASHKLIVLQQKGWQDSVGVRAEMVLAWEMGLTIEHMEVPAWEREQR